MEQWYIEQSIIERFQIARASGKRPEIAMERLDGIKANADRWTKMGYAAENLRVENSTAVIPIEGVMINSASVVDAYYAEVFGDTYTTYPGLIAQITAAENDPRVEDIVYAVNTPGGDVNGVDQAAMAIANTTKPSKAVVTYMAASAGYYLASQAGSIVAQAPSIMVGSIGVVVHLTDTTKMLEKYGVSQYAIASSNAPKKAPELHSEEFKAGIQERVDALAGVFVQRVAEGRSRATGKTITAEQVESDFGRGGMVLASAAMSAGMIDAVESNAPNLTTEVKMGEPVTAEALAQAKEDGATQERARVMSLLPFMATDSDTIATKIEDGSALTPALMASLAGKMQEQAIEAAEAKVKVDADASAAAAAAAIEADAAPAVSDVDVDPKATEADVKVKADEAFLAKAMGKSTHSATTKQEA